MKLLILLVLAAPTLTCMGGKCCGGCMGCACFKLPPLCLPQLQLPRCCSCGGCACFAGRPAVGLPITGGCGAYGTAAAKPGASYAGSAGAPVGAILVPVRSGGYAGAPLSSLSSAGGAPLAVAPAGGPYIVPGGSYVAPGYAG